MRVRRSRVDALAAVAILVGVIYVAWSWGNAVHEQGLRWRLSSARRDYERAMETGTVERHGGYTDGSVSGWVWVDQLVLDPAAAVVHDPTGGVQLRAHRFVVALGDKVDTCHRVSGDWFWCTFS